MTPRHAHASRRAFTLLETMLASALASMVVLACVGIMYSIDRTDRMLSVRASQRLELEHARMVMERAFSCLLMTDEPRSGTTASLTDAAAAQAAQPGGVAPSQAAGGGSGRASDAGSKAVTGKGASASVGAAAAEESGQSGQATGDPSTHSTSSGRTLKPPPPPRLVLVADPVQRGLMAGVAAPGGPVVEVTPQRLEVVLHTTPIPQQRIDPLDMPLPPRSHHRPTDAERHGNAPGVSGGDASRGAAGGAGKGSGRGADGKGSAAPGGKSEASRVGDGTGDGQPEELDAQEQAVLPVRALRGAFELHPQPPAKWRPPGIPSRPVSPSDTFERTGLWELWWMPMLPPGTQDTRLSSKEQVFSGLGTPFLVAKDLKSVQYTAFFERNHRQDLTSTWTSDLPAYMEVKIETGAGLTANWMFEIDYATGPEVAKRPEPTGTDSRAGGDTKAGDASGTGGKGASGTKSPTGIRTATPTGAIAAPAKGAS